MYPPFEDALEGTDRETGLDGPLRIDADAVGMATREISI